MISLPTFLTSNFGTISALLFAFPHHKDPLLQSHPSFAVSPR